MDYCALVRRDHDDMDCALAMMVDAATPPQRLPELLDVFRLALAVHLVADQYVLDTLLAVETRPRDALRWSASQLRREHALQHALADELAHGDPSVPRWCERVQQLRTSLRDHTSRHDYMRTSLETHVSASQRRQLASRFATERMRALATTSPFELARRVHAA